MGKIIEVNEQFIKDQLGELVRGSGFGERQMLWGHHRQKIYRPWTFFSPSDVLTMQSKRSWTCKRLTFRRSDSLTNILLRLLNRLSLL
jgi:hypothetical protein